MTAVNVSRLLVGDIEMNCYLVENLENGGCFIVDPGADARRIIHEAGMRRPAAVLLTHGHYDHIGAADEVCDHFDIPLYIHAADAPKLPVPELNLSAQFSARTVSVRTQPLLLRGGDKLTLAGIELEVLHTPGHSKGSCCFLLPDGQGVLCGDTLFEHGYGRTDFADGSFHEIRQSLRLLYQLTPKMPAYPGHGEAARTGRDPQ